MKKKFCFVMIATTASVILAACQNQSPQVTEKTTNSSSESTVESSVEAPKIDYTLYDAIIEEYSSALTSNDSSNTEINLLASMYYNSYDT